MLYIFALFTAFVNNKSLYESFGFYTEKPIMIGFLLFSDALAPMDAVVKLLMNILSRKYEFEAGMDLQDTCHETLMLIYLCRCLCLQTRLLQAPGQISSEVADPESQHHGRRLDVCQLPLLSPNPNRASRRFELEWTGIGKGIGS